MWSPPYTGVTGRSVALLFHNRTVWKMRWLNYKHWSINAFVLFKGRKRRRIRWSNTRTRRKKKSSEDEDDNSDVESSEEEESEEEDDSDEDYKVERSRKRRNRNRERRSSDSSTSSDDDLPPNDDPCKHCGLPNHPELVSARSRVLLTSCMSHATWGHGLTRQTPHI